MPYKLFNERKTAQASAFLLYRAGGQLPLIKLMKLLYLAERQSLQKYGEPITGDKLVSMDNGPVLSMTLNHMNGLALSCDGGWDTWVADRADHMLALRDSSMIRTPVKDLRALSDSDLEVLEAVWAEFGHWERWELVRYTHDKLPEWQDPQGSVLPITYETLLDALGFSQGQAGALVSHLAAQANLASVND